MKPQEQKGRSHWSLQDALEHLDIARPRPDPPYIRVVDEST